MSRWGTGPRREPGWSCKVGRNHTSRRTRAQRFRTHSHLYLVREERWPMFESIFDDYRKAVDSSFKMQQQMYRQWMNGWPIKTPGEAEETHRGTVEDQIRAYRQRWSETLAETLEKHRETLNAQYRSGI